MDRFWEVKPLDELTTDEWESLCDRCGKCCTVRLEDIDTGTSYSTSVACQYYNQKNGLCLCYEERSQKVPDCVTLTPSLLETIDWLPANCAYRLITENQPLASWHPLVSGDRNSTEREHQSIQGRVINENDVHPDDVANFILEENW